MKSSNGDKRSLTTWMRGSWVGQPGVGLTGQGWFIRPAPLCTSRQCLANWFAAGFSKQPDFARNRRMRTYTRDLYTCKFRFD